MGQSLEQKFNLSSFLFFFTFLLAFPSLATEKADRNYDSDKKVILETKIKESESLSKTDEESAKKEELKKNDAFARDFAAGKKLFLSKDFDEAEKQLQNLRDKLGEDDSRIKIEVDLLLEISRTWKKPIEQKPTLEKPLFKIRNETEMAKFYTAFTAYGLYSGALISVLAEAESNAAVILPALSLGMLSGYGLYKLDSTNRLGYGVPSAATNGLLLGYLEGILWVTWIQANAKREEELSPKMIMSVIWGSASTGLLAGGFYGHKYGMTPGHADFIFSSAGLAAFFSGLGFYHNSVDNNKRLDHSILVSAISLNLGALAGAYFGKEYEFSTARVNYLNLGALGGLALTGGLLYAFNAFEANSGLSANLTLAGGIAGYATAWQLTKDMKRDKYSDLKNNKQLSFFLAPVAKGGLSANLAFKF